MTRDCTSAEWDCNCKYTKLWDYMACCIQDYCGDIDVEDADDTLHGYCNRINIEGEFPSLLQCKDDEPETSSTVPKPTETSTTGRPAKPSPETDGSIIPTSQPTETSDAGSADPTAGGGQEDGKEEADNSGSDQSSTLAVGVGVGVGIPICAGGLGLIAFFMWRRNKARGKMMDSPASEDYSFYSPGANKTPKVEPESGPFVYELHSESRRAELPG